jgi:mono/diheme cytochrome c family protein
MRRCTCWLALVVFALAGGTSVAASGDLMRGKQLAEQWCASCHLVSANQATTTTEAPPFETVARRSTDDLSWLAAFLADPHPPMPQLSLRRDEIRDLTAYIASLR